MHTGREPARARERSKIGLMRRLAKTRRDTVAKRSQAWWGNYCEKCGARCKKPSIICAECRGPIPYIPENFTPTTEFRDLLSKRTRKRLEEWEREQRRKHRLK